MRKIKLQEVRSALIALDFLSREESDDLSDDELKKLDFRCDLEIDSLDFILLLERLEGANQLSLVDVDIWNCQTVQDLINFHKES